MTLKLLWLYLEAFQSLLHGVPTDTNEPPCFHVICQQGNYLCGNGRQGL